MHRACCVGGRIAVWTPRRGVVHGVFAGAVNLRFGEAWWTLLAADRCDQPSGIRLAVDTPHVPVVQEGDPVEVRAGHVRVGEAVVDCRSATRWLAGGWPAAAPGLQARLRQLELAALARAWGGAAGMARAVCEALEDDDDALDHVVRRVVGCGAGLTPSGDDVLVGLLAGLGMRNIALRERLARALAPALHTSTSLSRHLVEEAALGLPGRALYELGVALLSGAHLADATERVLAIGATSGADAALGLVAGARHVTWRHSVIPAEAGIQGIETRGSAASPSRKLWIPASAGMTKASAGMANGSAPAGMTGGTHFVVPAQAGIQGSPVTPRRAPRRREARRAVP